MKTLETLNKVIDSVLQWHLYDEPLTDTYTENRKHYHCIYGVCKDSDGIVFGRCLLINMQHFEHYRGMVNLDNIDIDKARYITRMLVFEMAENMAEADLHARTVIQRKYKAFLDEMRWG